jgi:hypothetical protein
VGRTLPRPRTRALSDEGIRAIADQLEADNQSGKSK